MEMVVGQGDVVQSLDHNFNHPSTMVAEMDDVEVHLLEHRQGSPMLNLAISP
jgi:hypothetical protein